jgi:hypothetical protein
MDDERQRPGLLRRYWKGHYLRDLGDGATQAFLSRGDGAPATSSQADRPAGDRRRAGRHPPDGRIDSCCTQRWIASSSSSLARQVASRWSHILMTVDPDRDVCVAMHSPRAERAFHPRR